MMKEHPVGEKIICVILAAAVFFVPLVFSGSPLLFKALKLFIMQCLLIAALAVWFRNMLSEKRLAFAKTPIDIPVFLLLILALLSLLFSSFRFFSSWRIVETVFYVAAFYLVANCLSQKKSQKIIIYSALAGLFLVSLYGFAQYAGLLDVDWASRPWGEDFGKRIFSTEGNPNWLASYLILLLPLAFAMLLGAATLTEMLLLGLIFLVAFVALLATNSWAAFSGFLISIIIVRLRLVKDMSEREFQRWRIFAWSAAVILSVFLVIKGPAIVGTAKHMTKRIMHWQVACRMIKEHPFLGVGPDNFQVLSAKYEGRIYGEGQFSQLWQTEAPFRKTFRAHNEYLEIASELGITGFVISLFALALFLKFVIKKYRRLEAKEDKFLCAGLAGGLIAVCIEAFFGFPFHLVTPSFFSALFLGMIVGLGGQRQTVSFTLKPIVSRATGFIIFTLLAYCLVLTARPLMAAFYVAQAEIMQNKGDFSAALQKYERAKIWQPRHPGISFQEAVTYRKMKEYDKAISAISDSLREEPYLWQNYMNLAMNYTSLKDYKNAVRAYESIVELKPRYADALRGLAFAYLAEGDNEGAITTMQKLIEVMPDPWAHNSMGVIYGKRGEFAKAIDCFGQAGKIEPSNIIFSTNLKASEQRRRGELIDPLYQRFIK